MPLPKNYHKFNPFLRPSWRMSRVLSMVDRIDDRLGRSTSRDDDYVRTFRKFLVRYRNARDERTYDALMRENHGLWVAWNIYRQRNDPECRKMAISIEARILAAQTDEEIAREVCVAPEAVEWYEALFFAVRDRMTAHDWILDKVLIPALAEDNLAAAVEAEKNPVRPAKAKVPSPIPKNELAAPFMDSTLKFFAFFGGKFILEFMMSGFKQGNIGQTRDETISWLDGHYMGKVRHASATAITAFRPEAANVMQLFALHTRLIEIERSQETAEDKSDQMHRTVQSLMQEMPWAVGRAGEAMVAGTPIAAFDKGAAEARDSELQSMAVGEKPDTIDEAEGLVMPRARIKARVLATAPIDSEAEPVK